jgi:hypothetical protein
MTVALIILGVIVFLAIDGFILYKVFAGRRSAHDYGAFPVPGETSVMLSPGKLKLSYQESYKAGGTEDSIDFGVPAALVVSVTAPSGEELAIRGPGFRGMGESLDTGSGWSRALIGTVEVTETGEHTVSARGELPGAIEPQVLVGK